MNERKKIILCTITFIGLTSLFVISLFFINNFLMCFVLSSMGSIVFLICMLSTLNFFGEISKGKVKICSKCQKIIRAGEFYSKSILSGEILCDDCDPGLFSPEVENVMSIDQ